METLKPRGRYFEEFEIGMQVVTSARTITETDVVNFAGLSGDYNQIHVDLEFCKETPLKERIAHGLLVLSIASGLVIQTGIMEGTILVFREIRDWKFIKPVFFNNTIHVEINVVAAKAYRRLGGGLVDTEVVVKNQDEEIVMKGLWSSLVKSKPE